MTTAGVQDGTGGAPQNVSMDQFSLEARTQRVWDINHALWFTRMGLGGGVFLAGRILNLTEGLGSLLGIPTVDAVSFGAIAILFGGSVVGAGTAVPLVLALVGAAAPSARAVLAVICCVLLVESGFWLRLITLRVGIFPPVHIPSVHRPQSSGSLAGG